MKSSILRVALAMTAVFAMSGCQIFQSWFPGRTRPAVSAIPSTAPTVKQLHHLDDAHRALDAGEYEVALALFREILAENPTITTAYLGIGQIYMVEGDYERAEPAYGRAARLEPRNFDAQYGHGLALQMLNRFVEAIQAYHRALTIRPNHPRANLNIATTYLQLDDASSALDFAEKAIEADPTSGPARANLGAVYEKLGRNREAVDQYLVAMELGLDESPPLMLNLINVLAKEERYREGAHTAENLVRVQPSANAYERLGWLYFRLGEYDRSIEAYRLAVEHDPNHWPSWSGVGVNALNAWLLSQREDVEAFREARQAFRQSLRINPKQTRLLTLMSHYGL